MKVLATGASGQYAGLVVPALVGRGIEVRAMVHDPDKADLPRSYGAQEVVQADLRDPASLDTVMRDVEGVFLITPAFAPNATQMGLNAVQAAVRAGVRKIVYSGVYHPSLSLSNHASTRPIEDALYQSDLYFVVLQPAMFMQGLAGVWQQALRTGTLVMPWSKTSAMSYVDYRDVADVVATAFADDTLNFGTFELASPGMVDRVRIAALMSDAAGRHLSAEDPAPDGASSARQPAEIRAMFDSYDKHGFHGGNAVVLRTLLQREPRTVQSFITELASTSAKSSTAPHS